MLTDRTTYNVKYPETTRIKESLVKVKGENMSKWLFDIMEEERQEGREEGMKQGMKQGMQQGMKQGIRALLYFVEQGMITLSEAANKLRIKETELKKYMST